MFETLKNIFKNKAMSKENFKKPEGPSPEKLSSDTEHNLVLAHLNQKNYGQWSKEMDIETHFKAEIPGYNIRVILDRLNQEKYVDYSRNMSEYKITPSGKIFLSEGGFK